MSQLLDTKIEFLKGVGPLKAEALKSELGIFTVGDLISHYPFRHEDRSKIYTVAEIQRQEDVYVQLKGQIFPQGIVGLGPGRRFTATFRDHTGEIELVWFKSISYIEKYIKPGIQFLIHGKISNFKGRINMAHPELEALTSDFNPSLLGLTPVYPLTEGLKRKKIENKLLNQLSKQVVTQPFFQVPECLPVSVIHKFKFVSRTQALADLHFPPNLQRLEEAKRRLKFDELFYLQIRHLQLKGNRNRTIRGLVFEHVGEHFNTYYNNYMPFELTNAQKRVLKEIRMDVKTGKQMNRLLQGDVGSGKTMVAMLSMLLCLDNGHQACIMAPTEILAIQHGISITEWMENMNVNVALLTGSTTKKNRTEILRKLAAGEIDILVGTHALLEEDVAFQKLGFVVIDEQHRFGVAQRARLWKKGQVVPHVLVMTATPIPRTLAMAVYGDLDVSVIDELPAGRKPIVTVNRHENTRPLFMDFLRDEIAKGRQIYYVFPLIEDSEKLALKSLMSGYDMVCEYLSPPKYKYSFIHGKMKPADKESEMKKFKQGQTNIMVATTVIEVGVNVPNASVMVIENAERFGLAQLHQLRGRVGRGAEQSYCILISGDKLSENGKKRIKTMVKTNDGFEIAKVDLELRGPGELDGTKQSGVLDLKLADIRSDESILIAARNEAILWLEFDEMLMQPESLPIRNELSKTPNRTIWSKIS
jgi:ATP-dependent DNA helicase RecG